MQKAQCELFYDLQKSLALPDQRSQGLTYVVYELFTNKSLHSSHYCLVKHIVSNSFILFWEIKFLMVCLHVVTKSVSLLWDGFQLECSSKINLIFSYGKILYFLELKFLIGCLWCHKLGISFLCRTENFRFCLRFLHFAIKVKIFAMNLRILIIYRRIT